LVVEHAKRIADWIAEVHGDAQDDDFEAIVEYILQATKDPQMMNALIEHTSEETHESLMSLADRLKASGRAEGEINGRAQLLLQLLAQRFGKLPSATRARIGAGTLAQLERWASRLLAAATLDDVFAEP
jgi:predicted transposase YdaD